MLASAPIVETVADFLAEHPVPLVVDPVILASSGRAAAPRRRGRGARRAAVPAGDGRHAELHGGRGARRPGRHGASSPSGCTSSARRRRSSPAVTATEPVDHLFDGRTHTSRSPSSATTSPPTHGAGCTHSATLAALWPRDCPSRRRRARRRRSRLARSQQGLDRDRRRRRAGGCPRARSLTWASSACSPSSSAAGSRRGSRTTRPSLAGRARRHPGRARRGRPLPARLDHLAGARLPRGGRQPERPRRLRRRARGARRLAGRAIRHACRRRSGAV